MHLSLSLSTAKRGKEGGLGVAEGGEVVEEGMVAGEDLSDHHFLGHPASPGFGGGGARDRQQGRIRRLRGRDGVEGGEINGGVEVGPRVARTRAWAWAEEIGRAHV